MNLNKMTSGLVPESVIGSSSKNVLANDVEIKGTIKFESELIFDGKIDGEILSEGALVIGKNAEVRGEVKTKSVTVHGTVLGNITVSERAELKSSSQLTGDLTAARIVIEEGATFIGKSEVTPNRAALRSAETARANLPSKPVTPAPTTTA
ncbi:MAG: bactofilin family protein [Chthoniobacterales bacterium]